MSALSQIEKAGFKVFLAGDKLAISPAKDLTSAQCDYISSHKQEIINELSGTRLQQNIKDQVEERAAIMEFDGGLTRKDAEQAAAEAMRVYCYRTTDKPNSELVAIMSGAELDEATESLRLKYGDRLLDVYPSPYCLTIISPNITKH